MLLPPLRFPRIMGPEPTIADGSVSRKQPRWERRGFVCFPVQGCRVGTATVPQKIGIDSSGKPETMLPLLGSRPTTEGRALN